MEKGGWGDEPGCAVRGGDGGVVWGLGAGASMEMEVVGRRSTREVSFSYFLNVVFSQRFFLCGREEGNDVPRNTTRRTITAESALIVKITILYG